MNKDKIAIIAGAIVAAGAILVWGTLALFTARTDSDFTATAGTVTIDLKDLSMSNYQNINPGDNDPSNPSGSVEGTEHIFTYDVYNTGNKSIRTRHTIILNVDKAGESEQLLDARYLALFDTEVEIAEKYYIMDDDSVKTVLASDETQFVKAVKYVFLSDVFDGKGTDINNGGNAEKESIPNVVKQNEDGNVVKTYSYDFSLLRMAGNAYQGCDISITVMIEAMQYRNTSNDDWSEAAIVVKEYTSSDVGLNTVPAANEDKNGNIID